MKKSLIVASVFLLVGAALLILAMLGQRSHEDTVRSMVERHAKAWETGDDAELDTLLHKDVVFAYPGRRLNKEQTLDDLRFFRNAYRDTKVYVNKVIVDGDDVAIEWQFATTKIETGKREVVSDAVIAHLKDGKFDVWKEYLDGRVKGMQADGTLELEEGEEPFPWPKKIEIRAD